MRLPHCFFSYSHGAVLLSSHLVAFFQHRTHICQRRRYQLLIPTSLITSIALIEISICCLTRIKMLLVSIVLVAGSSFHSNMVSIQTLVVKSLTFLLYARLIHIQLVQKVIIHFAILLTPFHFSLCLVQLLA